MSYPNLSGFISPAQHILLWLVHWSFQTGTGLQASDNQPTTASHSLCQSKSFQQSSVTCSSVSLKVLVLVDLVPPVVSGGNLGFKTTGLRIQSVLVLIKDSGSNWS